MFMLCCMTALQTVGRVQSNLDFLFARRINEDAYSP